MKFTICALCKDSVVVGNCLDGICRDCWDKIKDGKEPTITNYFKLDVLLESFPKSRGRALK